MGPFHPAATPPCETVRSRRVRKKGEGRNQELSGAVRLPYLTVRPLTLWRLHFSIRRWLVVLLLFFGLVLLVHSLRRSVLLGGYH